jgi:hypothetical protein
VPPIDDRTSNRNYQKPNIANSLADDVTRLRAALDAIDADINSGASVTRSSASATINLSNGTSGTTIITLPKTCIVNSIQADKAALVILYSSASAATADAGRTWATVAPTAGAGVIAQVTLAAAGTQKLDPSASAVNQESSPSTSYTIRVRNDGTTGNVVIAIAYVILQP